MYKNFYRLGFTLLELLFVLLIISILVSFSIITHKDYQERTFVTKDGMLLAKNCIGDLVSYCVSNPGKNVNPTDIPSCQPTVSLFGNVTFSVEAEELTCLDSGELPDNYTLIVRSSITDKYYIKCTYFLMRHSYECSVEKNF